MPFAFHYAKGINTGVMWVKSTQYCAPSSFAGLEKQKWHMMLWLAFVEVKLIWLMLNHDDAEAHSCDSRVLDMICNVS